MNIRPIVETTFHHHFANKGVDRTSIQFKKVLEWAIFDCESAIERMVVPDKQSVVAVIAAAVEDAEKELDLQ